MMRTDNLRSMTPSARVNAKRASADARFAETLPVCADVNLYAPVQLTTVSGVVAGHRLRRAVANGLDSRAANTHVIEVAGHRPGAATLQPLVGRCRSDRIGTT